MFDVRESLTLTIIFAITSGCFLTLATAATAYPAFIDKQAEVENNKTNGSRRSCENFDDNEGQNEDGSEVFVEAIVKQKIRSLSARSHRRNSREKVSKSMWRLAYCGNLFFAMFGGIGTLIGSWFGPLSIFAPIKQVSQITSGLIIFSFILKTEKKPSKDSTVGNYIVIMSAVLLIFVGAEVKDEIINGQELLMKTSSKAWGGTFVIIALFVTFPYQFILGCKKPGFFSPKVNFACLLATEVSHAVVGTSCAKLIPLLEGQFFVINFVIFVITVFTLTYSSVLRSVVVTSQTMYVPLMLSLTSLLNGVTGLLIWEDDIINAGGYICAALFFVLGVYLISDYDVLPGKDRIIDDGNSVVDPIIKRNLMSQRVISMYSERETTQSIRSEDLSSTVGKLHDIEEHSREDESKEENDEKESTSKEKESTSKEKESTPEEKEATSQEKRRNKCVIM